MITLPHARTALREDIRLTLNASSLGTPAPRRLPSDGARAEVGGSRGDRLLCDRGYQVRPDGQVTYRQPRCERSSEARPSGELIAVWSERGS